MKSARGSRSPHRRGATAQARAAGGSQLGLGALALAIVLFGIGLRATLPPVRLFTPDEQTYATLAASFTAAGFGRYPQVIRDYRTIPDVQELPPPTRVGYFVLAVGAMRASGESSPRSLALLSTVSSMLILALATFATYRWFGGGAAVVAALLLSTAPIDLAMARRAWQDDVFALLAVAMLLALLARGEGARWRAVAVFFALGAYALLVKETAVGLLGLGTAVLAAWAWRDGGARAVGRVLAGCTAAAAAAAIALAAIAGGFGPLRDTFAVMLRGHAPIPYVIEYQTGGPMYYVTGLAILQPAGALLAAIGAALALARPGLVSSSGRAPSPRAPAALAVWTAGFVVASALYPVKSLRFLSPMIAPAAMLGGIAVTSALRVARVRLPRAGHRAVLVLLAAALLLSSWLDLARFNELFVRRAIPDLATPWFTGTTDRH